MQKTKVTTGTHITKHEDSAEIVESSVLEESDEFLDEIDHLLEDQDKLAGYIQRGGQ